MDEWKCCLVGVIIIFGVLLFCVYGQTPEGRKCFHNAYDYKWDDGCFIGVMVGSEAIQMVSGYSRPYLLSDQFNKPLTNGFCAL